MAASGAALASMLLGAPAVHAATPEEQQRSLEELRNTLINLLHGLVERGVLTKEQADAMVKNAEEKAAADAAVARQQAKAQEQAEAGAVRVPYVPQIVQDQISKQVAQQVEPEVKKAVVEDINNKGALRAALPEWIQRMRWTADIRLRGEGDLFPGGNVVNTYPYLNWNAINNAGGIEKAGSNAFLNTTENQWRGRLRARFGFDVDLGYGWSSAMRLATGSTGQILATTNQTFGTYGEGYTTTIDQAFLRWTGASATGRQIFSFTGGRFENPWLSTDLVWYNDLTFEGLYAKCKVNFSGDNAHRHDFFITAGGFPIESYSVFSPNPTGEQKWLLAGQLGADIRTENDSHFQIAAAYYDYLHIVGQRDPFLGSTLYDWTIPAFVQKGNTMFDISNTNDPTVNLWALAANYRTVDVLLVNDFRVHSRYALILTAEALKNVGYNTTDVAANVGQYVAPRTRGYRGDVSFGTTRLDAFGAWRGTIGYRYLQRDAVLDAFNDEDFHLGGTDAKGYTLLFDFGLTPNVWMRAKYMSGTQIDNPPLSINVLQIDLNSQF